MTNKQFCLPMIWQKRLEREVYPFISDLALTWFAFLAAYGFSEDFKLTAEVSRHVFHVGIPFAVMTTAVLCLFRVYGVDTKYLGFKDMTRLTAGIVTSVAIYGLCLLITKPLSVVLWGAFPILSMTLISMLGGVRALSRYLMALQYHGEKRRFVIVGAGDAGEMIAREMLLRGSSPVCFIDDSPSKLGLSIHGIRVIGTIEELPAIIQTHAIEEVLIAMPSASGASIRRVFGLCRPSAARVRLLPGIPDIIHGNAKVSQLREVQIEDLLRRPTADIDPEEIGSYISGRRVLVTGAGGSIGSELCRQIMRFDPESLILLDHSENSAFEIQQELLEEYGFTATPSIVDIRDNDRLSTLFMKERPEVVIHAAAHKHVPLMQSDPIGAIENNVQGTKNVVEQAVRFGVEKLIYVSTDKAVLPSSIMGATKRVGELIVGANIGKGETSFAIVRFGNVLGSRGSLLPILTRQIKNGGPVRLTHPDMTRYFMTIPEAAQLILQAGAMGKRGEKFILDMDQPVKIAELATDLIRLHGLLPEIDIPIIYTGVRAGEKIHEELINSSENLQTTSHPKILVSDSQEFDIELFEAKLNHLLSYSHNGDAELAQQLLMEIAWFGQDVNKQIAIAA